MEASQEREIARGLRAGEADAWRALYDAHAEPVWRGVARLLGPTSADVADVVQETFLAAARSARSYDPQRGSLQQWLWGIARNQIALCHRQRAQQQRLSTAAQNSRFATAPEPPPSAAAQAESSEQAALIRVALGELSDDHAYLLTAKYLDDVSVAQIARQERSTEVAVRSKLARAREAFRQVFEKYTVGKEAGKRD